MQFPELSLVLPMYNVRQYVEDCLASIYAQPEAERVEAILVDDGSPDDSAAVAEAWLRANTDLTNWRIIHQENQGLGGARNTGLEAAQAHYVWFIDTDDRIAKDSIKTILKRLCRNKDVFAFNFQTNPPSDNKNSSIQILDIEAADLIGKINICCAPFNVYRAQFLRSHNLYYKEKFLHEDNEMLVRLIAQRPTMDYNPEVIYIYNTTNPASITNQVSLRKLQDMMAVFDSYENALATNPNLPIKVVNAMQYTCGGVLAIAYQKSLLLSTEDWHTFKKIIRKKKKQLIRTMAGQPYMMRIFNYLLTQIQHRLFFKFAYVIKNTIRP